MIAETLNGGGKKSRIIGLDLIRCCAILFVIAGHFFMNTKFHNTEFDGFSMFIQGTIIPLFNVNVLLFMILTGYLNKNKTVSVDYYKSGIRVIAAYLFFSVVTIFFRKYCLHEDMSWLQWGLKILDFSAIPYGWYIEMWIGLFLLTPFLNMLYKAIPTKRQKQILIATLYLLTALPDLFNRYGFHLVPGFWAQCFPLTFFFIGVYISEYNPEIKKWKLIVCILALCLINPLFNILYKALSGPHSMIQIAGGPWGVFGTVIAVAFFLLLYRVDFQNTAARKIFSKISVLSLDMYLCCWIFDQLIYPYFMDRFFVSQSQFGIWFFVIIPILFIGSFAAAWLKDIIFKFIKKLFRISYI